MLNGITVDDRLYNIACSVTRTARVSSSSISGMLLDNSYYNDAVATYLEYNVKLAVPIGNESEYALLYEVLTDPVPEHEFILPYNQTTTKVTGRVDIVQDQYVKAETRDGSTVNLWRNISLKVISNKPIKTAASMNRVQNDKSHRK